MYAYLGYFANFLSVKLAHLATLALAISAFLDAHLCGNQKRSWCSGGLVMPHGFSSHLHSWRPITISKASALFWIFSSFHMLNRLIYFWVCVLCWLFVKLKKQNSISAVFHSIFSCGFFIRQPCWGSCCSVHLTCSLTLPPPCCGIGCVNCLVV